MIFIGRYKWVLSPDITGIDLLNIPIYDSNDDKCLISTRYADDIIDFIDINNISLNYYSIGDDFKWELEISLENLGKVKAILNFKTGRYATSALYPICYYELWQCYQVPNCEPEYLQTGPIEAAFKFITSVDREYSNNIITWHKIRFDSLYEYMIENAEELDIDELLIPIAGIYDGVVTVTFYVVPVFDWSGI